MVMNGRHPCRLLVTLLVVAAVAMPACKAFGPSRVSPDRFDYNQAIARSTNEQMQKTGVGPLLTVPTG